MSRTRLAERVHKAFMGATSGWLVKMGSAPDRHDAAGVASFFDDRLRFYQTGLSRDDAESKMSGSFRMPSSQWAVPDTCDISLQAAGIPEGVTWTADCTKLVYRDGEVGVTKTVHVFGGPKTKLRSLTEPKIMRRWSPW